MKETRDKNVNEEDLNSIFSNLSVLEKKFINESKLFLSVGGENGTGSIHTMDLFISGIVNRAISLIHGYLLLAKDNNYISAVPLIRIQLDNCLRFYASTIVTDYNDFFLKYLAGEHIGNLVDAKGKIMSDTYLAKQLDKNVKPGIRNLYRNTSGHIHLSNEHSFLQTEIVEEKERTIRTKIGNFDFFEIDKKVDFSYNFFVATELLLKLVSSWKYQKVKVELEIKNNSK